MAVATPVSAALSDRIGIRPVLLVSSALTALSGFVLSPLLGGGSDFQVLVFLALALGLMGLTFAPLGALLPSLFPTNVRYTGASSAYNLGGILGGIAFGALSGEKTAGLRRPALGRLLRHRRSRDQLSGGA